MKSKGQNYQRGPRFAFLLSRVLYTAQRVTCSPPWVVCKLGSCISDSGSYMTLILEMKKKQKRKVNVDPTKTKSTTLRFQDLPNVLTVVSTPEMIQTSSNINPFQKFLKTRMSTKDEIDNQTTKTSCTIGLYKSLINYINFRIITGSKVNSQFTRWSIK